MAISGFDSDRCVPKRQTYRTGKVDLVMPDATALWLAPDWPHSREYIEGRALLPTVTDSSDLQLRCLADSGHYRIFGGVIASEHWSPS
jgi:hypothetical protein